MAWLALVCSAALTTRPGWAGGDEDRVRARALGEEGIILYRNQDFTGALERFDKAEALVEVPTLALRAARCLERLGRWVDAAERYQRAALMPVDDKLPSDFQEAQRSARQDAESERRLLLERIPTLTLDIRGKETDLMTLDEKPLPRGIGGQPLSVDPGSHVLVAKLGNALDRHELTLAERDAQVVRIELHEAAPPLLALTTPPAAVSAPPPRDRQSFLIAGVTLLSAAGVASSVGVGAWIVAADAGSDLEARCPGRVCDPSTLGREGEADLARQSDAKTAMIASFVTAGALTTAGVVVLAVMPASDGEPPKISLSLGPIGVGLRGAF